jgi:parvulin-like peptidyl-prolyl isomerase
MAVIRKNPYPWMLFGGGVLLVLAGLTWVIFNKPIIPLASPTPATASQVQRVSLTDAKAALDSGAAVFLDVRDRDSYAVAHIPGAVLIPISDLPVRMGELDPKSWIIPYCT